MAFLDPLNFNFTFWICFADYADLQLGYLKHQNRPGSSSAWIIGGAEWNPFASPLGGPVWHRPHLAVGAKVKSLHHGRDSCSHSARTLLPHCCQRLHCTFPPRTLRNSPKPAYHRWWCGGANLWPWSLSSLRRPSQTRASFSKLPSTSIWRKLSRLQPKPLAFRVCPLNREGDGWAGAQGQKNCLWDIHKWSVLDCMFRRLQESIWDLHLRWNCVIISSGSALWIIYPLTTTLNHTVLPCWNKLYA